MRHLGVVVAVRKTGQVSLLNRGNNRCAHMFWPLCTARAQKEMEETAEVSAAGDRASLPPHPDMTAAGCVCSVPLQKVGFIFSEHVC